MTLAGAGDCPGFHQWGCDAYQNEVGSGRF
jgi:hypothetical protein